MKRAGMLSVIAVLSMLFVVYSQYPVVKDELISHYLYKSQDSDYTRLVTYNVSPDKQMTLECVRYYKVPFLDSVALNLYKGSDTLNKVHITTFYKRDESTQFNVDIHNILVELQQMGSDLVHNRYLTHSTWSKNLDTVYVFVQGSSINDSIPYWQCFAINISSITDIHTTVSIPSKRLKVRNRPNPFRTSTLIQYTIPKAEYVAIHIYNNRGRLLRALGQKRLRSGTYTERWDGKDNNDNRMASGEYYYQVVAGEYIATKKMLILK